MIVFIKFTIFLSLIIQSVTTLQIFHTPTTTTSIESSDIHFTNFPGYFALGVKHESGPFDKLNLVKDENGQLIYTNTHPYVIKDANLPKNIDSNYLGSFGVFRYPFLKIDKNYNTSFFRLKNGILKNLNNEIISTSVIKYSIVYKDKVWLLALNGSTEFWHSKRDEKVYEIYNSQVLPSFKPINLVLIVATSYSTHRW
ncbi:unnamed protein product [Candida verbasci]|uniref:Uncharacterized protein n=1 Tax=Candida verbasci TaxID=1227364 RepID=A0A9W4TU56_9ASCO|nr:unnamed protein product [Candida verbasci]